jgi:glycosyltransferase involved in cell wall biosynthesis
VPEALPLVAICTPVLNGERYLEETMASVQAQTYGNVVHVVLNNCSSDGTAAIIEKFKGGRVPIITARNEEILPLYKNWNKCLTLMPAETAYFRTLGADDLIEPTCVEKMVAVGERDPAIGVIACGVKLGKQIMDRFPPGESFGGKETTRAYFNDELDLIAPQVLFRKRRYDRAPGRFFDENNFYSDMDCVMQTMAEERVGYVHEVLSFTRVHEESQTTKISVNERVHCAEWLIWLATFGAAAMPADEVADLRRRFQRYYYRRMMRWQFVDRNEALMKKHLDKLAKISAQPSAGDYADAVVDWGLKQIGLRPGWSRYPY